MLILYKLDGCPFCKKVIVFFEEMGLPYEQKSINDPENLDELIDRGGKNLVPYFYDTDTNIGMYESEDIIDHVQKNYMHLVNNPTINEEEDMEISDEISKSDIH